MELLNYKTKWSCGGLNPGLLTCEASTLPLSYSPVVYLSYKLQAIQQIQSFLPSVCT